MIMEKQFFLPGDPVKLRQNIPNAPVMYVLKKVTKTIIKDRTVESKVDFFQGILCRWFTTSGEVQEAVYNTKDLIKL